MDFGEAVAGIWARGDSISDQGGNKGDGEKQWDSGYVLKVEASGVLMGDSGAGDWQDWENGASVNGNEKAEGRAGWGRSGVQFNTCGL